MNAHTPSLSDTLPGDAQACGEGGDAAMIERQLWILGRLAELGLNIAAGIERQATQTPSDADPKDGSAEAASPHVFQGDLVLAFDRVSRSVRLDLALQARLMADRRNPYAATREQVRMDAYHRRERIERIVVRVAEAEHDAKTVRRLYRETTERLKDGELYGDVLNRPLSEIIAEICRDMGLSPDWTYLAREGWAREEIMSGLVGPPLAAFAARGQETPPPRPIPGPYWPAPHRPPKAASP